MIEVPWVNLLHNPTFIFLLLRCLIKTTINTPVQSSSDPKEFFALIFIQPPIMLFQYSMPLFLVSNEPQKFSGVIGLMEYRKPIGGLTNTHTAKLWLFWLNHKYI
jgi:hypothetical protein